MTRKFPLALALAAGIFTGSAQSQTSTDTRVEPVQTVTAAKARTPQTTLRHRKPRIKGKFRVAGRQRKAIPGRAPSATPVIHANIVDCQPEGIYTFTPAAYGFTPVTTGSEFAATGGSAYADGVFYAVNGDSRQAYTWNTDDWQLTSGPVASELVHGVAMTANPADGTLYSCAYNIFGQGYELVTVDPVEFVRSTTVGTLDRYLAAIFFDLQGNLLGFDSDGKLFEINRDNATLTLKGDTGISAMFNGAAVVDPASGVCFYAVCDWDCSLYEVDLTTCQATHLYDFDEEEEIASIFILPEAPDPGAPAKATGLAAGFDGGALSGTVSFTAPATTHSGATGSGTLTYTLSCNDAVVKTGTCGWGATVSVPYTAAAPGMHSFAVVMSNDAGTGRSCGTALWIGNDAPAPVGSLNVTRTGQTNNISWQAPAGSAHGGHVDFSQITYRVTRYPGNTVVADNLTATSYADPMPDGNAPVPYHYGVEAVYNGIASEQVRSNQVMVGAVYHNSFDNQSQFDEFTSVSLAVNGPEWGFASWHKAASVGYNEEGAVSAWLTSPALTLSGADTYTLSFETWCSNDNYNELLSVYIADTDKPAQLYSATPLINKMTVNWESDAKKTITAEFQPPADGTYHITFNGCSGIDLGSLYLDNVLLYRNSVVPLPAAPTVSAEVMGGSMAIVTIVAPDTDTDGTALESIEKIVVSIGDDVIHTVDNPAPGQTYNFFTSLPDLDSFYISAVAYTEAGPSAAGTYLISRIEAAIPRPARITSVTELDNTGQVTLTWDAPATDLNNNPIKENTLKYAIYADGTPEPIVTGITARTHTWQAVPQGEQAFKSFYVVASNEAGSSMPSKYTVPAPFGTPDTAPYSESFASMQTSRLWNFYNEDDTTAEACGCWSPDQSPRSHPPSKP
ncbi:MAG: choice-of-anchor J domain-containing protein, partial [Muribaculaceae bacterium]|nr:choice-of-anchor J domain-containing protein [Muribaculaceae bacterium]